MASDLWGKEERLSHKRFKNEKKADKKMVQSGEPDEKL